MTNQAIQLLLQIQDNGYSDNLANQIDALYSEAVKTLSKAELKNSFMPVIKQIWSIV